jgi:hypothetical protein
MSPQQRIIHDGVWTIDQRAAINEMMEELFATQVEFDRNDASVSPFVSADVGEKTLLAAADKARAVVLVVTVTEAYADAGGTQPTVSFGQGNLPSKYATVAVLDDAAAEADFSFGGILSPNQALTATFVAAVSTGTGACRITAIAENLNAAAPGDEINIAIPLGTLVFGTPTPLRVDGP